MYTGDDAEAWGARPGADLSDLGVIGGAANPGAALQLLQPFLLLQVWSFCTANKKAMHHISLIRTHTFLSLIIKLIYHELYPNLLGSNKSVSNWVKKKKN